MSKFWYYLHTLAESGLSIFGVRGLYEQPAYRVLQTIPPAVEIRQYEPRTVVETPITSAEDGAAFQRLFRYITGANKSAGKVAMTVPVEQSSQRIAMTIPVEMGGPKIMRFFLPEAVVKSGAPAPTDPLVHIVTLPPATFAVLRFSGLITDTSRRAHEAALMEAVTASGRTPEGPPSLLSYDPPFALPFVRRNEVAVKLEK